MQQERASSPHSVISRGSAPRATFQIPDTGLRPPADSFLTRFRGAVSLSTPPAAAAAPAPPQKIPSQSSNMSLAAAVAATASAAAAAPRYIDLSRPSQAARADASAAELAADAAEDTLINVLTDTDTDAATDPVVDFGADRDTDLPDTPTKLSATSPTRQFTSPVKLGPAVPTAAIAAPAPLSPAAAPAHAQQPEPAAPAQEPAATAPVLRFCASSALLDQHALDQLGLPLGFVWSPFGALPSAVRAGAPPPRCGTCAAFLAWGNGADAVLAGARVWTCAFCGRNDNDAAGWTGHPALRAAAVEYAVPDAHGAAGGVVPNGTGAGEAANVFQPQARVPDPHAAAAVPGADAQPPNRPQMPPGAIVLVVDEAVSPAQAACARAAAASVHAAAVAHGLRFALLTVGAACAAADDAGDGDDEARHTPTLDMLSVARAARLTPREKDRFFLSAPSLPRGVAADPHDPAALAHFHAVTDPLIVARAPYGDEVYAAAVGAGGDAAPDGESAAGLANGAAAHAGPDGAPAAGGVPDAPDTQTNGVAPASSANKHAAAADDTALADPGMFVARDEPRRLDVGIFVALELLADAADCDHSRVITLLTGPPTLSEHAQGRRRRGGSAAHGARSAADGASGTERVGGDDDDDEVGEDEEDAQLSVALTRLYEQVGSRAGEMRVALDFLNFGLPTEFGAHILLAAAKRSRGGLVYGAAHAFSAAEAVAEAATYLAQRSTTPGVVSIRVSSPLVVARVIGPAYPTAAPHTYAVPGVDPTAGFTIILKTKAGAEDAGDRDEASHTIVQLAAKSGDVTRVVTARVPVTRTPDHFLAALDAEVCALVLAKACVVSAGGLTKPAVAARSVDEAVRRLLYGSEAAVGVARLLYELRRGTLLHGHLSADASLVLRAWFLRAECGIASLLMSPRLFTDAVAESATGLMGEVALERQHVREDAVLVLDTGFNVFVYVGADAGDAAEEAICKSAQGVAGVRVSPCQLWKLRQGADADFVLDAYLSRNDGGKDEAAIERGFVAYCQWLAPKSDVVRALRYG